MFIAIDAKAVAGSKKGKMTPAQHAQLNAWCLAKKTGILDCLGKCTAKNNYYTAIDGNATIAFNSGYVVICGRLVECEEGTTVKVPVPTSGTVTGKIILRFSLGSDEVGEFVVTYKTGSLQQDDLNANPKDGVYEFELYEYEANYNGLSLSRNNTDYIPALGGKLNEFEKSLTDEGKPLGGYDTSKGTIEERLTRLGFKSGALTFYGTSYAPNNETAANSTQGLFRQGNYVVGKLKIDKRISLINSNRDVLIGIIPENFRPVKEEIVTCYGKDNYEQGGCVIVKINPNGSVSFVNNSFPSASFTGTSWIVNFGYEAPPIE